MPCGIAVQGDLLAVVDSNNFRVQVFTLVGRFVTAWPLHLDEQANPCGSFDSIVFVPGTELDAQVVVTNLYVPGVMVFRLATGEMLHVWSCNFVPYSLKFHRNHLLVLGTHGNELHVLLPENNVLVPTARIGLDLLDVFAPSEFVVWAGTTLVVTTARQGVHVIRMADGASLCQWNLHASGVTVGANRCIHLGLQHDQTNIMHVVTVQLDV